MTTHYPLNTGERDALRLQRLHDIYAPYTQTFLQAAGLQSGMQILEVGCGTGLMAILLAQAAGPNGHVVAIDRSAEQLQIAKQNAQRAGVDNIEFICLDVLNIKSLNRQFDFIYDRWLLMFLPAPFATIRDLFSMLKPNGILTTEEASFFNLGLYSYPAVSAVQTWGEIFGKSCAVGKADGYLADKLYSYYQQIGCQNIVLKMHQPVLTTPIEKSVLALGAYSFQTLALQNGFLSEEDYQKFIAELTQLETQDVMIVFVRNALIRGRKPG